MVRGWLLIASLIMDSFRMTQEEYVDKLKTMVPSVLVEDMEDWSVSDKLYVYLHMIQLQEMADIKELLKMVLQK